MTGLIGQFTYSVDHKGRLSLPAKIRKLLPKVKGKETVIITKGLDGCLYIFPAAEWGQIEAKIRELPRFEKKTRDFVRNITRHASESELDAQGRITIPQLLLDIAHIKAEVLIIGAFDRIELWDPETHRKYDEESGTTYEDAAQDLLI